MTFRQALAVLWRRRLIIVAAVLAALLAGAAYAVTLTAGYRASATVQTQLAAAGALPVNAPNGPQTQLITADAVVRAAAAALHTTDVSGLRSALSDSTDPDTGIVTITATDAQPSRAVQLANAAAQAYVTARLDLDQQYITAQEQQETQLQRTLASLRTQQTANRGDPVIAARSTAATAQLDTITTNVETMRTAPQSAALLSQATDAARTTTSKGVVLAIALAIGLLAGCGLALLRNQFDTRVRTAEDAEHSSGRPVLAQLPYVRAYRRGSTALPVVDAPRTAYAESVRELRTSAAVLLDQDRAPVVVITSPAPFDGKTLAAANLAASWALAGKHTVLVSGDLRRPHVQHFFDIPDSAKGLAELLAGEPPSEHEVTGLLRATAVRRLSFLPSGRTTGDPADGLAGAGTARTVEALRSVADLVLVDAPPVLAVSDAAIIATRADGVIVVARSGRTKDRELAETMKRLRSGGASVLGVALNRVKGLAHSSYGSYYRTSVGVGSDADRTADGGHDDAVGVGGAAAVRDSATPKHTEALRQRR